MTGPIGLTTRMYEVGFGDCFLLTFHYKSRDRHLLIDFGSTRSTKQYMKRIAEDIHIQTKGKLDAIVATHRHKDHISGFATYEDVPEETSGGIIAGLNPDLVSMTWTEDPDLAKQAIGPIKDQPNLSFIASLSSMERVAKQAGIVAAVAKRSRRYSVSSELEPLSEINIPNKSALQNLLSMGKSNKIEFLHYGKKSHLTRMFRGVKFHVLGPPTVEQSANIKHQIIKNQEEYWHLANYWNLVDEIYSGTKLAKDIPFTGKYRASRKPSYAKWLIQKMQNPAAKDLLRISRVMDHALNNTSVILLIEVEGKKLLFPGDAQIESWDYVLNGPHAERNRKLLAGVNLYKVGHHASLNGTPKTLWKLMRERKDLTEDGDLVCLLSSRIDIHGKIKNGTEVPRKKLVDALKKGSELLATAWDIDRKKILKEVSSVVHRMDF